jgi:hypothetical protein
MIVIDMVIWLGYLFLTLVSLGMVLTARQIFIQIKELHVLVMLEEYLCGGSSSGLDVIHSTLYVRKIKQIILRASCTIIVLLLLGGIVEPKIYDNSYLLSGAGITFFLIAITASFTAYLDQFTSNVRGVIKQ